VLVLFLIATTTTITTSAFVLLPSSTLKVHDATFRPAFQFCLYESNKDTSVEEGSSSSSSSLSSTMITTAHKEKEELNQMILNKFETYYPTTATKPPQKLLTFHLQEYKPLGLTAEESLAPKDVSGTYHHVFVSKVIPNGNADKVGIQVGDVIVGISGLFGSTECVVGESLEKVKGMIASQRDHSSSGNNNDSCGLVIKVVRGSLVMNDHESALVDLCTLPENEAKVDQCIETLYKRDYDLKVATNDNDVLPPPCDDAETECMLDALFSSWENETDLDAEDNMNESEQQESGIQKPAPWSSRSSPSGTFVRDPKTGKMINIDA
jgi:hypothetical protein